MVQIHPWLRLAPAFCLVWAAAGILTRSSWILLALVSLSIWAAATRHHPFDLLYNRIFRKQLGTVSLPPYPAPRRFMFLMSGIWLGTIALGHLIGLRWIADLLGALYLLAVLVHVMTGFCILVYLHSKLFGPSRPYRS
jgi:hypothetical protein